MVDRFQLNQDWFTADQSGNVFDKVREGALLATLLDIRNELRAIRRRLDCETTILIPQWLRKIETNTRKRRARSPKYNTKRNRNARAVQR